MARWIVELHTSVPVTYAGARLAAVYAENRRLAFCSEDGAPKIAQRPVATKNHSALIVASDTR